MIGEWEKGEEKKVCYFDIDGVLNDYPNTWLKFLRENVERTTLDIRELNDLNQVKYKMPYQIYKNLKYEYRESGYKKTLEADPSASGVTHKLKKMGYHIVIITSRPLDKHPSLFKQTVYWLDRNNIAYDDLIFSENKHIEVLTRYPHLKFGVDDHRYYCNLVASWQYRMFILNNDYNQGALEDKVTRIDSLVDIFRYV